MKLGIQMGYWGAGPNPNAVNMAVEAEKLGYDAIFTAEAWGSDVFTPLAWMGAHTSRIRLGTAVAQLSARTPTATAMAALTLDHLSGGRMILGLGVSGPQVVEGWYGQPFAKPLSRTREYVNIIRQVMSREAPVANIDGAHYPLPYTGEGAWGLGKSLKPITHPLRADLPIFLGAEGPKNVAMAAEIADGWLPLYYSPYRQHVYADQIKDAGPEFEICQGVTINICDDIEEGLIPVKNNLALYIGGMGAKKHNFHTRLMGRMGFEAEATAIQDLFLAGKKDEAVMAVPSQFADEISLVGPVDRIKDRIQAWRESSVTSLLVSARNEQHLQTLAELVLG
ncbi:MAG TPA: LLM class F420-dependent oxidoreductase [Gammaproteobacteria bacterium]|nr:LLM class F420-dependent oxidoreductase [Gammaproteobacteria bacterium]